MKRKKPNGEEYTHCEAYVPERDDPTISRFCRHAAAEGDRLCLYHARMRDRVNNGRYIISISKKHVRPILNKYGGLTYPKYVIGKIFMTREDAELWARLNGSLIWRLPDVKSYCIEHIFQASKA